MKKTLLVLAAMFVLTLTACKDNSATQTEQTADSAAVTTEATAEQVDPLKMPSPTGEAEKDAKACVDYLVASINAANVTDEAGMKDLDAKMNEVQKVFEDFYKDKPEAKKAFDEAGKKLATEIDLESLIANKVKQALGDQLKNAPEETKKAIDEAVKDAAKEAKDGIKDAVK